MKKIFVYLCTAGISLAIASTVSAEEINTVSDIEYSVLTQLGAELSEEDYINNTNVYAGDFAFLLSELVFPGKATTPEEAVYVLYSSGVIADPAQYDCSTVLTYERAVKDVNKWHFYSYEKCEPH